MPLASPNTMNDPSSPGAAFTNYLQRQPGLQQQEKIKTGLANQAAYNRRMAPKPRQTTGTTPFGLGMNGEAPALSRPFGTGMNGEPPAIPSTHPGPPPAAMPEVPATNPAFMGPQQPSAPLLPSPQIPGAAPASNTADQPGAFTAFVEKRMAGVSPKMGGRRRDRLRGGPMAGKRVTDATEALKTEWLGMSTEARLPYGQRAAIMP